VEGRQGVDWSLAGDLVGDARVGSFVWGQLVGRDVLGLGGMRGVVVLGYGGGRGRLPPPGLGAGGPGREGGDEVVGLVLGPPPPGLVTGVGMGGGLAVVGQDVGERLVDRRRPG